MLTLTLTLTSQNGFQGQVTLQVTEGGQPPTWLNPTSMQRTLNVPAGEQVQESLQVTVAQDAPTGSHSLNVKVVYENQATEGSLTLVVNPLWTIEQSNVDPGLIWVNYSNGRFLALSNFSQTQRLQNIWISPDGRNWSRASIDPGESPLLDIAYDGSSTYLAVGSRGTVFQSQDGQTWSRVSVPSNMGYALLRTVTYAAGKWIVGSDIGIHIYDGSNWQTQIISGPDHFLRQAMFITYGGGKFVVAGTGGRSDQSGVTEGIVIYTSNDGVSWQQTFLFPDPYYSYASPRRLLYDAEEGRFLLAGDSQGNIQEFFVLASPDGSQWRVIHAEGMPTAHRLFDFAFGGGTYLVVTGIDPRVYSITPGIIGGGSAEPISGVYSLTYGNGQFVGVGTIIASRRP